MQQSYEQRGYLNETFRLFHLREAMEETLDWHYHTFHKIMLFLGGACAYGVEGKRYLLQPGDLVLVGQGCIHRPEAQPGAPYERIILYLSPEFLGACSTDTCELSRCFLDARERFSFVLRPRGGENEPEQLIRRLEQTLREPGFGQALLAQSQLLELLICLGRLTRQAQQEVPASVRDEKVLAILQYLSADPTREVTIDDLAARFYISKYHMMRRFRAETGYTIHAYLVGKRLLLAKELIASGVPVLQAAAQSGFPDYSAFSRAYRKQFGAPPGSARQNMEKIKSS